MGELDKVKDNSENNTIRISLMENNHTHLTDKFDLLYDAVRDLTQEIKNLNIRLAGKKRYISYESYSYYITRKMGSK
jgi:hypothetical protein